MVRKEVMGLAVLLLGGCAAIRLPADRVERSEAGIRLAEEAGALEVPAARLQVQLAKEQLAKARRLAAAGDGRAALVLERAAVDSELAVELAREAAVHAEALRATAAPGVVRASGPQR